ncbi:MAG: glutamyl-tRNA reductase, partial [Pirellulaceae bacterium]
MMLQVIGCDHQNSPLEFREKLAFDTEQVQQALLQLRELYPLSELVLLSTCNRVELYVAAENESRCPGKDETIAFFASFHDMDEQLVADQLRLEKGESAVRHLFATAA